VELSTDQRGSLAEVAVAHQATRLGVGVLWPLTAGLRYDLVFDVAGQLFRVQCKTARRKEGIVVVNCRSCRRTADGYDRRSYSSEDVDRAKDFDFAATLRRLGAVAQLGERESGTLEVTGSNPVGSIG
jgi:PD-(D/E)XK endonuclease